MGVVFEALHLRLRQRVAIKMLFPHVQDSPGAIARFEREARAAGQLRSPNVARVLDVETGGNGALPYMVMEFLEGNDLDDEVAGMGRLPVDRAVDYILQASLAMREAHSLGIVHRDLKPANLFLCRTADGPLIKVLDFGISKITSEIDGRLTSPLQTMGSPVYMSPEQLRAKDVDARADIWSLGVTLFELLTGRPPHTGTTTAMIASILSDPSPRPSSLRREVPPGLDATVLKALAKNPADRYQDALELAEALSAFASPEGVKRLRATLAMPAAAPSGRRLFSLGTGDTPTADRSAPVAALRADKSAPTLAGARTDRSAPTMQAVRDAPELGAKETAQNWSTAPLVFAGIPRRHAAMVAGVGVLLGVVVAVVVLVFDGGRRPPAADRGPAQSSAATVVPEATPPIAPASPPPVASAVTGSLDLPASSAASAVPPAEVATGAPVPDFAPAAAAPRVIPRARGPQPKKPAATVPAAPATTAGHPPRDNNQGNPHYL